MIKSWFTVRGFSSIWLFFFPSVVSNLMVIPFALGLTGLKNAYQTIYQDEKVKNPLQTQYFSMVPYRLGKQKI